MSAAGGGATSAVSVLAPNGRRVTVRVGPSTALIQVGLVTGKTGVCVCGRVEFALIGPGLENR